LIGLQGCPIDADPSMSSVGPRCRVAARTFEQGTLVSIMPNDLLGPNPEEVRLWLRFPPIEDLHAWLKARGDWIPLGAADEKKPAADGTVEAWGRSADNPVGGWYGLRSGYRGRFGMYMPPLMEELGLAKVSHDARNNRMRAI